MSAKLLFNAFEREMIRLHNRKWADDMPICARHLVKRYNILIIHSTISKQIKKLLKCFVQKDRG